MHADEMENSVRHVVILGQMGVGKSTLGRALAPMLEREHADCDEDLHRTTGRSATEHLDDFGLTALHEAEAEVLLTRLAETTPLVISAAASVIDSTRCRAAMTERAVVVWIDEPAEDVDDATAAASHRRSLSGEERAALDRRRRPRYADAADVVVGRDTPVDAVGEQVRAVLGR